MEAARCSVASLAVEEPLAGTAVEAVDHWLLLEVTDAWAPKALQTPALSTAVRDKLTAWLELPRSRLQLIRRPGRTGKRPLFMSSFPGGRGSRLELDAYDDLLDVDLDALSSDAVAPVVLVCAHGRRDRCCAQHGAAVYRALQSQGAEVWQTSHLGGHRFAACVLTLPDGYMYGRLRAEHAPDFSRSWQQRELADLEQLRGRCALTRPEQAAEIFLRQRTNDRAMHSLAVIDTRQTDDTWHVRFTTPVGETSVRVRREYIDATRPVSCGGEPEPVTRFVEV